MRGEVRVDFVAVGVGVVTVEDLFDGTDLRLDEVGVERIGVGQGIWFTMISVRFF